jgi:zinc transport system ATP-binding protein
MEPLLKVSNLQVELNRKLIIQNLSFKLVAGETLVILGPNGAGKTVLLRTLLGLVPHKGEIFWRSGTRRGYVPQRVPFNRDLPVTVSDFFELKGVNEARSFEILEK